jgi:hypothetical protein
MIVYIFSIKYIFISQIDPTLIQFCSVSVIKKNIADYRSVFPFSGHALARFVVLQVKISPLINSTDLKN